MDVSVEDLEPIERYYLLLLYAPDSTEKFAQPIKGQTWSQKEMFLLSKFLKELERVTEYNVHLMGSYSEIVEEVDDQFYISEITERIDDSIKLSLEGRKIAEDVWKKASDDERWIVTKVKTLLNDLSYYELLGFIYTEYPETAIYSEKLKDVEAKRLDIAISLLEKGKVSLEGASQIAKKTVEDFLKILNQRGVEMSDLETKSALQDKHLIQEIQHSSKDSKQGRLIPWKTIKNSL